MIEFAPLIRFIDNEITVSFDKSSDIVNCCDGLVDLSGMQSLLGLVGPDFVVSTAHVLIVCEEDASMGVIDCCHIRTTLLINS